MPGTVFSSSKIKPKNRVLLYTEYIRRCSLVLSASSAASAFLMLVLVLLLLLLLASAAAASAASAAAAAASAAAAAAATALRTAGWSCSVFFSFPRISCESYMVMDVVVQHPQKSSGYDQGTTMRKKYVSRDSKMCCCCCRFCCGAPTTDERIHAPVLHDASQIDYCRY